MASHFYRLGDDKMGKKNQSKNGDKATKGTMQQRGQTDNGKKDERINVKFSPMFVNFLAKKTRGFETVKMTIERLVGFKE